jgi:hypothetical protein
MRGVYGVPFAQSITVYGHRGIDSAGSIILTDGRDNLHTQRARRPRN